MVDERSAAAHSIDGLLPILRRLDGLLEHAVASAGASFGEESPRDPFRGLYVSRDEVEDLLARDPAEPVFEALVEADGEAQAPEIPALNWLASTYGLSSFDLSVLIIALAAEIDLRYERVFAYLNDNVSQRRPTVDIVVNLLCPTAQAKVTALAQFAPTAPLVRHHLIELVADPSHVRPPLLAHYVKLDDQVARLLLGGRTLDPRLADFCELAEATRTPDEQQASLKRRRWLSGLIAAARRSGRPLRLSFEGLPGSGRRETAEALAAEANTLLLIADVGRLPAGTPEFEQLLRLLFREAWFLDAILYIDHVDALRGEDRSPDFRRFLTELANDGGVTILAGSQPWRAPPLDGGRRPLGVVRVPFKIPEFDVRRALWSAQAEARGIRADEDDFDTLAGHFRLTPGQIAEAVATAANRAPAAGREGRSRRSTAKELLAAARAHSSQDLGTLAVKISPVYRWGDLVVPDATLSHLREICSWIRHRHRVLDEWGFARKLSHGRGVNALFEGPSGTGKTMSAEIVAGDLGLDLYRIDLAGIVSKWVGETEKNLDRIFRAAEYGNAVLCFNEAEVFFGRRSEVHDALDRYANMGIAYLLQRMEEYEGLAILTTNMREQLDEAFVRRLAFAVHFPFPEEAQRREIWRRIWPRDTPLADDVDLDVLAREFRLSGGNIKNVALGASFLAAEERSPVTMAHVLHAVGREYEKLGRTLSEADLVRPRPDDASEKDSR